ncbi:MAG TPA: M50 family metallopeptidase, partial [Phycicoccus sp.]|nr:M50 family metallopeptidase [Phycicoccus sp.]
MEQWRDLVWARLVPTPGADAILSDRALLLVVVLAAAVVLIGPIWRVVRLGVTLVHELGHAFAGILSGRRFTGFVLRGDMSGHAVTVGPTRGVGRVITTWAGYPMPALVAVALAWVVNRGYAGAALAIILAALLVALPRVRSVLTLVVLLAVALILGALWWWRDDARQAGVLVGIALILLVGGWRHLWAVLG